MFKKKFVFAALMAGLLLVSPAQALEIAAPPAEETTTTTTSTTENSGGGFEKETLVEAGTTRGETRFEGGGTTMTHSGGGLIKVGDIPTGNHSTSTATVSGNGRTRSGRSSSRARSESRGKRYNRRNRSGSAAAATGRAYSSLDARLDKLEASDRFQDQEIQAVKNDVGWLKERFRDIRGLFYAKYDALNEATQENTKDLDVADQRLDDIKKEVEVADGRRQILGSNVASLEDSLAAAWKWIYIAVLVGLVFAGIFIVKGARKALSSRGSEARPRTPVVPPTTSH
jgi:hypothetical protein